MARAEAQRGIDIGLRGYLLVDRETGLDRDGCLDPADDRAARQDAVQTPVRERLVDRAPAAIVVAVEAASALAAQVPRRDEAFLDRRGTQSVRLAQAGPDALGGSEVDVEPREVHELERSHRVAGVADRSIDRVDRGDTFLEHPQRLERERP